ncbi:sugar fermentation stimulation protein A [Melghiribacillus thermohalophilus]|uniref:Sugar fermentation stimulation protein homolog n=1 Tax=Melghiribacillus thermohalophilus TaxID=1324956 RepID=A0A4R3N9R5_9BACI|nr:DNA/RNA nuclease SfsA [Melghiribacillus thermohalophilus]TCT25497.1 sugar fermentation stimulation protein A [Melghiribacillus thermohalophilus]
MFIPFEKDLHEAVFIKRENRFILTCKLTANGQQVTVHLQDPGRLKELLIPGNTVYLSYHDVPHRKTKWTAELVRKPSSDVLVSLRSTLPNRLIERALKQDRLPEFSRYQYQKREYTFQGSRWDFLLTHGIQNYILEIKSVTFEKDGIGYFPDAPTKRGTRHVRELREIRIHSNIKTGILFVCQREDIDTVRPAHWIDPDFTAALQDAEKNGVDLYARTCHVSLEGISLQKPVPVRI